MRGGLCAIGGGLVHFEPPVTMTNIRLGRYWPMLGKQVGYSALSVGLVGGKVVPDAFHGELQGIQSAHEPFLLFEGPDLGGQALKRGVPDVAKD